MPTYFTESQKFQVLKPPPLITIFAFLSPTDVLPLQFAGHYPVPGVADLLVADHAGFVYRRFRHGRLVRRAQGGARVPPETNQSQCEL